ncbi:MAG: SDR family oxidoreductase [Desulfobacterales bacterium]|nr:SDR family oxidoreductase [Desulfobacterales bacterium]
MIDPELKDKVVLVTGANHGIGASTARIFADQGAKVFLTYFREPCEYSDNELKTAKVKGKGGELLYRANQQQTADSIIDSISLSGGKAAAKEIDLSDHENIPNLFNACENEFGSVDILINNHTYCALDTFDPALENSEGFGIHLVSQKDIDVNFSVNTRSYVLMMSEYIDRFLKRKANWGRIINISTDAAHAHEANVSYAASKHAIESYSRSAAIEMGKYGITINIIAPGPIQTGYLNPEEESFIAEKTPLRRIGRPEDVADAILLLASEQAHWLTGQLLYVGGGWRMHQ